MENELFISPEANEITLEILLERAASVPEAGYTVIIQGNPDFCSKLAATYSCWHKM
jgi:hypothetical protein